MARYDFKLKLTDGTEYLKCYEEMEDDELKELEDFLKEWLSDNKGHFIFQFGRGEQTVTIGREAFLALEIRKISGTG